MNLIKSKKNIYLVMAGLALILSIVTGTYAFFNYTRTGTRSVIETGRIVFATNQNNSINLTNLFPIESTASNLADSTKVGTVTIDVSGDTTYGGGVEYLVTAVNVVNTVNQNKHIPISIQVEYIAEENKEIGTSSTSYFTSRGSTTSVYKVLSESTINNGDRLLVGYIAPGQSGIDGTINIKAYLDASRIAISDTYDGTESDNMGTTNNWVNGRTVLTTEEWNLLQNSGISFQVKIEANEGIWVKEQIKYNANGGDVSQSYKEIENNATTYGTLAIPTPPAGYQFDGWYTDPVNGTEITASTAYISGTSATTLYAHYSQIVLEIVCPGSNCKYMYADRDVYGRTPYQYGGANNPNATLVEDIPEWAVKEDYTEVIQDTGKNIFLGFTETQDGKIDRAFVCGIKEEDPNQGTMFCVEGSTDGSTFNNNKLLISGPTLWNGSCIYEDDYSPTSEDMKCSEENFYVIFDDSGYAGIVVGDGSYSCYVS